MGNRERNEIEDNFKWNLDSLYKSIEEWEEEKHQAHDQEQPGDDRRTQIRSHLTKCLFDELARGRASMLARIVQAQVFMHQGDQQYIAHREQQISREHAEHNGLHGVEDREWVGIRLKTCGL